MPATASSLSPVRKEKKPCCQRFPRQCGNNHAGAGAGAGAGYGYGYGYGGDGFRQPFL